MTKTLTPLPQHRKLVEWLQKEEHEVWQWFADKENSTSNADEVRLSLLRDTYRMDPEAPPEVFKEIKAACTALELDVEVFAYQAENPTGPNAAVCYLPNEAHVVFFGPIISLLSSDELRALLGHELAHHFLWRIDAGVYHLADRILHAAASHSNAEPSHGQSARVWRLATELFADRGAFLASGSLEAAIGALVKTSTGIAQLSAKSYIAQAAEVFSKSKPKTDQLTHPENFVRTRALQLWVLEDESFESTIERMLNPEEGLDDLTLVQQQELAALTRRFLAHLLAPAWFQTEAVLAHARLFFNALKPQEDASIMAEMENRPLAQREYLGNLMLDFCAVAPDLHELPITRCLALARDVNCLTSFEKLLSKELKLKAKDMKKFKEALA